MIRAVIGTIAVLAGFAVLEDSLDASAGSAASCRDKQAYALLEPGEQLAVRNLPTPEGKVVGSLAAPNMAANVTASTVTIVGSQSGWARIALHGRGYTAIDGVAQQFGWIPADQLTVDTRVDGVVTTFSRPGALGGELGRIEGEDQKFEVLGCRGDWLQVINAARGNVWIDRWCGRKEGCRSPS